MRVLLLMSYLMYEGGAPDEACGTFFKARSAEPSGVRNAHSAEPSGVQNTYLPRDDFIHGSRTASDSVPQRHPGCENRILPHGGGRVTGKLEIRKQKLEGGVDGGGRKLETRKQKVEGGGMGGMT